MNENFGPYILIEELGVGGMGTVYRAQDTRDGGYVALKRVHPQLRSPETFVQRFKREARVMHRLNHPNILKLLDMGAIDGQIYRVPPQSPLF